ncbi:MAG: glycosyltransferase family 2 protein [Sphingobacteriaceae bacterium]|nr:MAG: glycosyltransferase family 2 protein [Sphingobacteriaceae bacterium]
MPAVSVIIPNYNHAQYLEQRINSVLQQTYRDFEVIIIDDHSTDNSRDVIEQYRDNEHVSKIIYNDTNSGGPFKQWERGINEASAEWVWIAESDDHADPQFLETLLKVAEKHANTGIAFSGSNWIDDKGKVGHDLSMHIKSFYKTGLQAIRELLYWQCAVQNVSSAIIRTDLAKPAIKGLTRYKACGDWIFYTRVLHQGNLVYTADKLNNFRWYHNNISNSAQKDGYWLKEGIEVLDNIDTAKVKFSFTELLRVVKFWTTMIMRSKNNTKKERGVLGNFIKRYIKPVKNARYGQ